MFESSIVIPLSEALVTAKAYACPLISSDVDSFLESTSTANKNNLLVALIARKLWEKNIQKTISRIYKAKDFGYEFTIFEKLQGTMFSQNESILAKQVVCHSTISINIKICVIDKNIHISSYVSEVIVDQHKVTLGTSDSEASYYGDFLLKSKKLYLSDVSYQKIVSSLERGFRSLSSELKDFELKDGDYLATMYIWNPQRYQTLHDYKIIAHCYTVAMRKFPLFKKQEANFQCLLLNEALRFAKCEIEFFGKKSLSYSVFSKALYYEIMANNLDYILMPKNKRFVQELKMQNWGRKISPTLLSKKEDFEKFPYSKVSPDNLIWVVYDNQNYPAYEMFKILEPDLEDVISSSFESFIVDNDEEEETYDD